MKKVIYYIGIYSICAVAHDYLSEVANGLGRRLHEWSRNDKVNTTKKERRSVNISSGTVGNPMNRIGF